MAKIWFSKAKVGQKSKKNEGKKVAPPGFEPGTSGLWGRRSNHSATEEGNFWAKKFIYFYLISSKFSLNSKILLNEKSSDHFDENFSFTIINFCHIFSLVNFFLPALLQGLYLVTKKFFFKITNPLLPWRAKWL